MFKKHCHHFTAHQQAAVKVLFAIASRTNILTVLPTFPEFSDIRYKSNYEYSYRAEIIGNEDPYSLEPPYGIQWRLACWIVNTNVYSSGKIWTPSGSAELFMRDPDRSSKNKWGEWFPIADFDFIDSTARLNLGFDQRLHRVRCFRKQFPIELIGK
jgi:hypothetical protein